MKNLESAAALDADRESLTADLPQGLGRTGESGEPVRRAGRGRKGRITTNGTFVATADIVENVRMLLASSWTAGDIKRALVKRYGGKGISFKRHIALARERNREMLGRSQSDAKADSTLQWSRWLAEEQANKSRAESAIVAAEKAYQQRLCEYRQADDDSLPQQGDRLDRELQALSLARDRLKSAKAAMVQYQCMIDRNLGNHAPIKIADATAEYYATTYPPEPLTEAEGRKMLRELIDKIRQVKDAEQRTLTATAVAVESDSQHRE